MKRVALLTAAIALAGCTRRYADFTLPPVSGGDPNLSFAFEENREPVVETSGDALNPTVTSVGATPVYLFSLFDGVWRTASGFTRTPEIVLSPDPRTWEGSYIAANGSALGGQRLLRYWYVAGPRNAGQIGLALSADIRTFVKNPRPVLGHGPFEAWDERTVADPYVISVHPYYYMYYLGHDRAQPPRQRIGVARSSDGIHWTKLIANPILSPGLPGSFDEAGVGEPAVWQSHNYYWMLYTGRDFTERRRLGLARSTDGIHWTRLPTVFSGASAWDSKVICDPTVMVAGDEIKVWFGGGDIASPDENLHGKIGYATLRPIHTTEAK